MAGNIADVITCAKFQDEIFRGYDFTGVEFPIFLSVALTTGQHYRAACDTTDYKAACQIWRFLLQPFPRLNVKKLEFYNIV